MTSTLSSINRSHMDWIRKMRSLAVQTTSCPSDASRCETRALISIRLQVRICVFLTAQCDTNAFMERETKTRFDSHSLRISLRQLLEPHGDKLIAEMSGLCTERETTASQKTLSPNRHISLNTPHFGSYDQVFTLFQ